ncbi:MAG: phage holin family protein, partial [Chloroflexota bacterium]|nr:phage holin family protein [Chloroflexota bacterium]
MQPRKEDRSLGELFTELARETGTLVRQEVQLATTEMTHKASRAARDVGFLAVGGLVAYAGVLALLAAVVLGLAAAGFQPWLAALIVGIVVAVIGYALVQRGLSALKRESLAPRQT